MISDDLLNELMALFVVSMDAFRTVTVELKQYDQALATEAMHLGMGLIERGMEIAKMMPSHPNQ